MELTLLNDEELISGLKGSLEDDGTLSSSSIPYYEALYDRYLRQGYSFCRYYGLRHQDAEDTVQDAFIKLFRVITSYQSDKPFKPWFLKVLLNLVRDRHRKNKRSGWKDLDIMEETPGPEEKNNLEKFQNQHILQSILNRMPEKHREVIILRIYQELDFEEMAVLLGVSSRQARNRLEQALQIFKESLEKENAG